ncbi:Ig-like domain-containing protein [Pseudomonas syringae]|uniref:Glycosyl hydrolase n=1 Tax=Pseudomonas syringae pv. actinidiae TaxID=103796 RepID=A0AAU8XQT2_PSESF|nr:Ig-like domain-containing protein [Pseudomonas syringae]ATV21041.1 glycosyl hydrolase [Pseudomonas syringae pv. actinidiae]PIN59911.1 glycosyl hydrolase [Pseudomonas syringae pv. actinidiae]
MLFDGAVAATVAEAAQPDSQPTSDASAKSAEQANSATDHHTQAQASSDVAAPPAAVPGSTVVFVDSRVKDSASLLAGVAPGAQVVELDATKDGLQQIADYLASHQGVSSVQIIAHGNSGDLWLGNSYVSADNIAQRSALLAEIGNDMNVGGDILIYACNTAEGDTGLSFVDSLATLTGRDVAASTNRTGVGGDWDLEIATGSIESVSALSQQSMDAYQWGLATFTVTSTSNTGTGSLREALTNAQNGDIVTFSTGMTVALQSQLVVSKNITIDGDLNNDGVADVTLDGQNRTSVIRVNSGVTATLDGVIITRGVASTAGASSGATIAASDALGGGINNAGNLTLRNVTVTANSAAGGGGGGGVNSPNVGGGGGGGGGIGGQNGAAGGGAGSYTPTAPSANTGGNGASFSPAYLAGQGGNSSGGGAGGNGTPVGYTNGGAGGTATSSGRTIGGGGGGSGFDANGGRGGSAVGGIYNASTGTLAIIGTSTISSNIGAGGGGGGGGTIGGNGGRGIGAIWNKGTVNITSSNNSAMTGNVGGSGAGGQGNGGTGSANGTSPTAVNNIFNDGGTLNVTYTADTTAPTGTSIVIANSSLSSGGTSLVTFTFSEPVFGLEISEITVPNGTLSNLVTTNNVTWTATLTASSNISDSSNVISLPLSAVQDSAGNIGTGTVTSNNYAVSDTVPPTVTVVVADTALAAGETSLVTFTFSEVVTGFDNTDISVANGTLTAVSSSDGGKTWTATLTPTANLISTTNQISLNRAGVQDLSGNAGSGTATSNNYAIDTSRPTATIVLADNALSIGETSQVTITFSEAVSGFTNADLTVVNGTLSTVTTSNNIVWTATFTPTNNITDSTNVITLDNTGVTDAAGNTGAGITNSNNYAIDTQRPTASILVADASLTAGETSLVTITFSEAVSGFTNADLTVPNGTLSTVTSSDGGITWTATYTPNNNVNDTTNLISLNNAGVSDLAGNAGSGTSNSGNFTIDTVRPSATVVVADSALSAGETSLVTITFSEAVTGFTNADLTVANGTLSAVSSSDGGVTWTATLTPTANVTDTTNLITLDASGVANASGNAGTGIISSNNYAVDTQRPTATIVVTDNALAIGETSLVTITFSEAVTGFTNADLTINNGTLSTVSSSDGGITWTATLTPTTGITSNSNSVILNNGGVADLAGNAGSGLSTSNNYAIDTARPTASISMSDSALSGGETSLVTITFSEAVSGFTNADLTVPNGTLSAVSSSDGGVTWTATYTPNANVADTTNVITLDNTGVADLAGNIGSGTTDSGNFTIATQQPTATVVVADSALSVGETSLVTITFSEAVSGFNNADLTVENGTLSAVSSSDGGITWTATFTPTANVTDASNLITLDNTGLSNGSGVTGSGITSSNNYAIDTLRPTATIVVADNALAVGETSLVTITFSEAVSGFTNADLNIANGTLSAVSSSDGGVTWTATLTPTAGITDSSNLIALNNAGVTDAAGNAGNGLTFSNNYAIDSARPTASIVVADSALSVGETSLVTITFSEAVSGFDNSDLSVPNGTLSAVSSGDGGITWTATFTPGANVADTTNLISLNNAGVADLAGNAGAGVTNSGNFTIDTVRPTATVVVADSALSIGETSLVTITFSEAVSGFNNADLTVENGTLSAVSSNDGGITWTATFTPTANITDTSNLITLDNSGVANASGNTGSGIISSNNYAIDTALPTATIVVADSALSIGETSLVTITFSEAVSGFTNADLTISNGTLSAVSSNDGGITWTATLTPTAGTTSASNSITLNNAGVTDLAGNAGSGLTTSSNYAVDSAAPTATIVVADSTLSVGETSLVTITFSEAVSGFDNSDLNVPNGTLSPVSSSDGGITWTATFTPGANVNASTGQISLNNAGVTDLAGNAGNGTISSGSFTVDTTRPSATIVMADTALSAGETSLVTVTFSQAVSGFSNADLSVANGTLSAVSSSDGGITWTATFTPDANVTDSSNLITLDNTGVTNASGNAGSGTTASNNYAIDTQRPTATIVVADSLLAIGETSQVTITFSEAVSGFSNADLTVANGTLSAVSSSDGGITWTATLTPTANAASTNNGVTLDNSGVTDLAGNAGTGTTRSNSYAVDQSRPTASIVVADSALSAGETSQVTITFSEAVNGFSNADLAVANGTLSAVSSNDGGITWTATFTPSANVTDASNLITLDNTRVADASGNTGSGITSSNNYAIDTVRPTATITVANPNLGIGQTSLVTFAFSERVTNFDLSDISVGNGTLSSLSSSDGGLTWTATLTPDANVTTAPNNFIVLDSSTVNDLAGNAGTAVALSSNYSIDNQRPTATVSIANPNLATGQTSLVTFAFSEPVNNFTLSDVSVANGTLSNLASGDGGATWTATLTPTANVTDPSNFIVLDSSTVTDRAGNAGTGIALSPNYTITTTSQAGDPQFRVDAPALLISAPNLPLQPSLFGPPTGNLGSPLSFAPLFEQRTTGDGLPPVGNIFITNRALAPSFIAQVFDSSSVGGPGSGFLGFNSGEGSVFGTSTLATLFSREAATDTSTSGAFNGRTGNGLQDSSQSIQAGVGALTLGQQLQQITDNEQEKLRALAWALGEVGVSEAQA